MGAITGMVLFRESEFRTCRGLETTFLGSSMMESREQEGERNPWPMRPKYLTCSESGVPISVARTGRREPCQSCAEGVFYQKYSLSINHPGQALLSKNVMPIIGRSKIKDTFAGARGNTRGWHKLLLYFSLD
jgi:hypothetical protein